MAREDLLLSSVGPLSAAFAQGTLTELETGKAVLDETKQTTAQQLALELEIDPEALPFSIGPLPDWMLDAARETIQETFQQDYWQRIEETTRDDIQRTLQQGVEDGFSVRRLASSIVENHGSEYSMIRALRVARTEIPNMMNSGHAAGMARLEEETGLQIGKEWISAFQTFTRASHAAMDGTQTETADGLFNLNGVMIPWPAHQRLPPGDRIECKCTILSAPVMDQLA